jgi:hypothetical protein
MNRRPQSGSMRTLGSFLNNPSMEPATKHRSLPECVKLAGSSGSTATHGWVALVATPNIRQENGWNYYGKGAAELPALKWMGVTDMFSKYAYQTCLAVKYYITISNNSTHHMQVYHGVQPVGATETGTVAEVWNGVDPRNVLIRNKVKSFQIGPKGSPDCIKRIKRIVFTKNYMTDSPMITANRQNAAGEYDGTNAWKPPWIFYVLIMSEANVTSGNVRLDALVNVQFKAVAYCKWTSKFNNFPNYS